VRPPPVATANLHGDPVAAATGSSRAYPRWAFIWATIGAVVTPGCNALCEGPGCESSYPQGRVDVVGALPFDGSTVLIDSVTDGAIVGSVVSGSNFHVATYQGDLYVGQPEARSVRHFATPFGEVDDDQALNLWQSDVDGFGTDVATLTTPTGLLLAVAAPSQDRGRGEVHVFLSAQDGPRDVDVILRGDTQGDQFGDSIHTCPDQTGDGIAELVVVSPWIRPPAGSDATIPALAGAVFWFPSEALTESAGTFLASEVGRFWWGDDVGDSAGLGFDCSTDLDGDGIVDLVIGAPQALGHSGRAYLLSGANPPPSSALSDAAFATIDGEEGANLGSSIATTVRDGVPFLLMGASGFEAGKGSAILVNATTLGGIARFEYDASAPDHLGRTVAVADLDGDGIDELIVGGPDRRVGQLFDVGQIFVFNGAIERTGLVASGSADQHITADQGFRRVGQHIVVSDLDGDGRAELLLPTRSPRTR
jgi:hypothetical protein